MTTIDKLVAKHTPFYTIDDIVDRPTYQPVFKCKTMHNKVARKELVAIADRFDFIMVIRGDSRRAVRV